MNGQSTSSLSVGQLIFPVRDGTAKAIKKHKWGSPAAFNPSLNRSAISQPNGRCGFGGFSNVICVGHAGLCFQEKNLFI
jgi:hypothetical protein